MRTALFSATLLASGLTLAATPIDGWYGSAFGGYTYMPNTISTNRLNRLFLFNEFTPLAPAFNNLQNFGPNPPRNGYNAGGRIGFQSSPMRYEAEITYLGASARSGSSHRFNFHSFIPSPFLNPFLPNAFDQRRQPQWKSAISGLFGMANVYYDFAEVIPCFSPFIGVGLGYGWVETRLSWDNERLLLDNPFLPSPFLFANQYKASDSGFAYQGTLGLTFNYNEAWALNLAYRYLGTTTLSHHGKAFQSHSVTVGLVYRFNEYNYK